MGPKAPGYKLTMPKSLNCAGVSPKLLAMPWAIDGLSRYAPIARPQSTPLGWLGLHRLKGFSAGTLGNNCPSPDFESTSR